MGAAPLGNAEFDRLARTLSGPALDGFVQAHRDAGGTIPSVTRDRIAACGTPKPERVPGLDDLMEMMGMGGAN